MQSKTPVYEILKKKYHKTEHVDNFKDMLYRSGTIYKKRNAFKLKDENGNIYNVTYEKFKNDVIALGTTLLEKGFKDKHICVIGQNSYKWAVSYLAASIIGIVVPIDKELHFEDVTNFMNISDSVCILGDKKILDNLYKNISYIKHKNTLFISFENSKVFSNFDEFLSNGQKMIDNGNNTFDNIKVDPNENKILLFTSGTTGSAKGVCLSHNNVCSNILSIYGIVKVKRSDLFFSILPLHHTYECTIGFLLPIYSGASIAYCEGLRHISKNINEYHPSVILCVPLLLENVHKKILKNLKSSLPEKFSKNDIENPFNNLPFYIKPIVKSKINNSLGGRIRVFIVGAAPLNPNISDDLESFGFRTLQGYGLTECSPLVAGNTDFFHRSDSPGLPIPNVEYKIDNPDKYGIGEIIVRGPNVMLGYFNDKKATEKAIVDGWFHTGDLGKIDRDGYLYITGRCKTVIVTKNGKNIYPEEIEHYLNESPLISEALVLGIKDDTENETYVNAQIFPNITAISEYLKASIVTKEEIKKIISDVVKNVNSKFPNYKHIKSFDIRETEFEKTTTQKIKRFGNNVKIDNKNGDKKKNNEE